MMRIIEDESDPQYGEEVNKLREMRKNDLIFGGGGSKMRFHFCTNKECSPQNNGNNVYLCKYGVVHLCSASRCEYYNTTQSMTCPISGIVMEHSVVAQNTYNKNDSRTWRSEEAIVGALSESRLSEPLSKKKKQSHIDETLRNNAENVVVNLLYSSNRDRRNRVALDYMNERATKARQTYVNERFKKRQLPYASDMCRVTATVYAQALPYVLYAYDDVMIQYYVEIIVQVWALVQKYAVSYKDKVFDQDNKEMIPRIDFESIALATLYVMRERTQYEGAVALPRDTFLFHNLPQLFDLDTYFSVSQNKVTKGTALLLMVYNNAKNDGAAVEDVCLNLKLLPNKDEKTSFRKLGE
jgi:hypothetical protein